MALLNISRKLSQHLLASLRGGPRPLPLNLTLSVTFRCNSRCSTCNVYTRRANELRAAEYALIFRHIRNSVLWLTFSGGEPFLRRDLPDIVDDACRTLRPEVVTLATNGSLTERVVSLGACLCPRWPGVRFVFNLSLDAVGERHDKIRGLKHSFRRVAETFRRLKALNLPNLTVGIHTVISRFNLPDLEGLLALVREWQPDSYVTEIAEERRELMTTGLRIAPDLGEYDRAASLVEDYLRGGAPAKLGTVTRTLRLTYYKLVRTILGTGSMPFPCLAGNASAHVAADGEVWACCIRTEVMGHIREWGYDLRRLWYSPTAEGVRRAIRRRRCACPLANAAYTNMILSPKMWWRLARAYLQSPRTR